GQRAALARVISLVENQRDGFQELLSALHSRLGRAHRIGITGPPGAGKSTLTSALVRYYRAKGERIGIVAVDPTSPYTGGALLGDRIRMNELALDDGVFIRSMATRGSFGGLALTTKEVADVMDAFGFDRVILETVGVGQSELGIASAADSIVVVLVPESGDSIQAMKAGLMEASDIFVINKADRPGAERMAREVSMMIHLRLGQAMRNVPAHHGVDHKRIGKRERAGTGTEGSRKGRGIGQGEAVAASEWEIPVLQTVAETGQGVSEVAEALDRHLAWLVTSGDRDRKRALRLELRVREEVERALSRRIWSEGQGTAVLEENREALRTGEATPYEVAARILSAPEG
ncbi:MAG: methylmalonyl Co-A mutase-associated GTPase MeaB, partial [Longimicrobiales bacterium]